MKIIDLLNKIANSEELPSKIIFDTEEYHKLNSHTYIRETADGITRDLYDEYNLINCLNDEIEIIEEEKKIKHIGKTYDITDFKKEFPEAACLLKDTSNKLYEIIDEINKLKENK